MKINSMLLGAIIASCLIGSYFHSNQLGAATFIILLIITHPFEWIEWRLEKNNEKLEEIKKELEKLNKKD